MKLSALFAKFLYQHRQLRLPGIGTFSIDPTVSIPDAADKNYGDFTQHIKFTQGNVAVADEEFINFIRTETGKIKPLAESDLESFLSDGKILLNIGKPFFLEGIGSLVKNRAGMYEFVPGEAVFSKTEHITPPDTSADHAKHAAFNDERYAPNTSRKILIALSVIVGLVLVIWLGYKLYTRNTSPQPNEEKVVIAPADTARKNIILDSVQKIIDSTSGSVVAANNAASQPSGSYKFIIERTTNKARAIRRFNQIKDNLTDVRLQTNADSTQMSLYFVIPATPADTTRIKDSLRIWYGRKEVFIEP